MTRRIGDVHLPHRLSHQFDHILCVFLEDEITQARLGTGLGKTNQSLQLTSCDGNIVFVVIGRISQLHEVLLQNFGGRPGHFGVTILPSVGNVILDKIGRERLLLSLSYPRKACHHWHPIIFTVLFKIPRSMGTVVSTITPSKRIACPSAPLLAVETHNVGRNSLILVGISLIQEDKDQIKSREERRSHRKVFGHSFTKIVAPMLWIGRGNDAASGGE
mmetsp:Transcript_4115/g.11681  ORF Transcript_4115/g.11681 Transcript_4115/m.11681 type:complete len:218 (+) Transcript_4115:337-990(+)